MYRNQDRISNLPEAILQFILSLMPLKYAVRTCILSKRWKYLWHYNFSLLTSLDFLEDFSNSLSPIEFVDVVERYIQLYQHQNLGSFRVLFCPFDTFTANIQSWIAFAAAKNVQILDIDLSQGIRNIRNGEFTDERNSLMLPTSLFECGSLLNLRLTRCEFCSPNFKKLCRLKYLHLSHVNVTDSMVQTILLECSELESLSLRNCPGLKSVNISGEELKLQKFEMIDCSNVFFLQVTAPTLKSLILFGDLNISCRMYNVSSLVDAFLSTVGRGRYVNHIFLDYFAGVKILTLCSSALQSFTALDFPENDGENDEHDPTINLPNLEEVQFLMDEMSETKLSNMFSFFLICPSPFLERLFVKLPALFEDTDATFEQQNPHYWTTDLRKPPAVTLGHLKHVKMSNYRGCNYEMRLVKFLLEKAVVLETLTVVAPPIELDDSKPRCDSEERIGLRIIRGQLSVMQKASGSASIFVCEFAEDDTDLNPMHRETYCEHSLSSILKSFETLNEFFG